MKIQLAILTLILILSLSIFTLGNEADLVKAIDVDLSVQKNAIFDQEGFLRKKGTNELDYIFSNNGLWLKSNSDFMVPIIFTGDFEISISVYTVGIFPKANPLATMFPTKTSFVPEVFGIELWPYITGTEEKLSAALGRIFYGNKIQEFAENYYQGPIRLSFAKNATTIWLRKNGYPQIYIDSFSQKSNGWNKIPITGVESDDLLEIIFRRQGPYLFASINGSTYDLSDLKVNPYFDSQSPIVIYFRGSKQQGIIPSILEALYVKSIKGVAQEGTFFNIQDVIAAQQ